MPDRVRSKSRHDDDEHEHDCNILQFSIETATDSLSDLDLRIVPLPSSSKARRHASTPSSPVQTVQRPNTQPAASARWIRRRILTQQDEIVDQIVDVRTGTLAWSLHRPVRGWYLHLRSPGMPADTSLGLQAPPPAYSHTSPLDSGTTPLWLALHTRLHRASMRFVKPTIDVVSLEGRTSPSRDFTAVNLDTSTLHNGYPPVMSTTEREAVGNLAHDAEAVRTSAVGSAIAQAKSHARRRSGGSAAAAASHSSRRSVSTPSHSAVVPEEGEGWATEAGSQRASQSLQPTTNMPLPCSFLLTDGEVSTRGEASKVRTQSSSSWARWAWRMVPEPARPSLRLDGSKSFSIYWIDAPDEGATGESKAKIEIVRFQDESNWWSWKGQRMGRLLIQQRAVQALNLDTALWISLSLAYLDFLSERDGYNAASEG